MHIISKHYNFVTTLRSWSIIKSFNNISCSKGSCRLRKSMIRRPWLRKLHCIPKPTMCHQTQIYGTTINRNLQINKWSINSSICIEFWLQFQNIISIHIRMDPNHFVFHCNIHIRNIWSEKCSRFKINMNRSHRHNILVISSILKSWNLFVL